MDRRWPTWRARPVPPRKIEIPQNGYPPQIPQSLLYGFCDHFSVPHDVILADGSLLDFVELNDVGEKFSGLL